VHFYEEDAELLDQLAAYIGGALRSGGSTIVIGTPEHMDALQTRLRAAQIDLSRAILEDRYIRLDAETTLARFMVGGWPDAELFRASLARPIRRAKAANRPIFAFGEMVALLWERGEAGAALELERLWNEILGEHPMSLLCAYPMRSLGRDFAAASSSICACHSHVTGLGSRAA
jgi:hypothetical protein